MLATWKNACKNLESEVFREVTVYATQGGINTAGVAKFRYAPCSASGDFSIGFVPLRSEEDELIEVVAGHIIMRARIETKTVPSAALNKEVDERCKKIEEMEGRKPGRKERSIIKDEARHDMIANAFSKIRDVNIWIDTHSDRIVIGATAASVVDPIITLLGRSIDVVLHPLNTKVAPAAFMTAMLLDEGHSENFLVGRSAQLESNDDLKTTIRYSNAYLMREEVKKELAMGLRPSRLALVGENISFVLTEGLQLKSIKLETPGGEHEEDAFDADVILSTEAIGSSIDALIAEMGGLLEVESPTQ